LFDRRGPELLGIILEKLEVLNNQLFLIINGDVGSSAWLVDVAMAIGEGLIFLIPALMVWLWLAGKEPRRGLALRAFAVAMLGLGINQALGLVWQHPRPFTAGIGHAWISHVPDSSFPSDHATVLFGVAFTFLFGGARRLTLAALACTFAVAWARVFLGVHFPLDMAGAAVVALAAWALIAPAWSAGGGAATSLAEGAYRQVFAWPISAGWIRR
jgi:undecaprenyl-diphosphatase